jgi:glycosyltransferase involved in cell wall biosynthesis
MARPRVLINALTLTDGGGWTYVKNLLIELDRDPRGFEWTLLVPRGRLEHVQGASLRTLWLPPVSRPLQLAWRVAWEQTRLPRVSRDYDLLYCVADMAPTFPQTPTVVALRNLNIYDERFFQNLRMTALRRLVPSGLKRVRRALFPSRAAADWIRELIRDRVEIPDEKVAVVPHGIAPEAFDAPQPVEHDAPFVFLPAALENHKNIEVLVEALPLVSDPRLELWVAGKSNTDPPYRARVLDLAERLGVSKRLKLLGSVPYERILDYHRASEALVFPSFIETFGHPLLEAMIAESPMVVSDIPTFHEIAGDAAVYFPADDPAALARALDAVRADPEARARRIDLGLERAAQFTWKRSTDRLCEVLREVLDEVRAEGTEA